MAKLAINGAPPLRARPFHPWPVTDDEDLRRLGEVMRSRVWGNGGPLQREFERAFAAYQGADDAITVTNGTVSLLLCLRALGIRPGDEVIVPGLTWIATATSVLEANGVVVFADVDPRTLCLDPRAVEAAITSRTVAIMPVHLYRFMADMDALTAIAGRHGLGIIEDCAHAHGGKWRDRGAGTIGNFGSFSFQSSKPMTAGEGGLVVARSKELLDKIYSQRDCGRHGGERGSRMLGGNQRMTEWQAAILLGQLERIEQQMNRREAALTRLRALTASLAGIRVAEDQRQVTRPMCYRVVFHYDRAAAGGIPLGKFVEAVRAEGVPIEMTYPPVYENRLYTTDTMTWYAHAVKNARCPVAESLATEGVFTLPHEVLLGSEDDLKDVAAALAKVLDHPSEAASLASRAKDEIKGIMRRFR